MSNLKEIIKHYWGELVYTFSNSYALALSMLASIIATAFIEPTDMGVIQSVMLVQPYLSFLHFGVFNGLNRNLAYYKAQGKTEMVVDMVNTTYTVSIIVALFGGIVSLGILGFFIIAHKPTIYAYSAVLLFVSLVFQPLANAIETTYRSGQEFKRLGIIKNIESTIYAFLSLLPIIISFLGKIVADSSKYVLAFVLRKTKAPYKRTGWGSRESCILLLKTGFPMLISNYAWTVFVSCDRTFIAHYLSVEELGFYTLATYVINSMMVVPNSFNSLLYPKAAANYGKTQSVKSLKSFWKKAIMLYSLVLIPICILFYFALPTLVTSFMPKYVNGIKSAQFSLLTCLTFISLGPSVIFATIRKNVFYIIILLLSIVLFWTIGIVLRSYFCTIESISLLRVAISFIQMIVVMILSYRYISK